MMYRERYDDGNTKCLALVSPGITFQEKRIYRKVIFCLYRYGSHEFSNIHVQEQII